MRVLVIQHFAPEAPYAIGTALEASGLAIDIRKVYESEPLPESLDGYSGFVVMGGPQAAYSDEGFGTRRAEIVLCEEALAKEIPTLGVCLGAQILAVAAGAATYPGHTSEVGWGTVQLTEAAAQDALLKELDTEIAVLHMHGDTFDFPNGATLLASNDVYANQAFCVGNSAWGFQFHAEVTAEAVEAFCGTFAEELGDDVTTRIRKDAESNLTALAPAQRAIVNRFAGLCRNLARHAGRNRRNG